MSNPKNKILPDISKVFVMVWLFHCVDAFYPALMGDVSSFGTNVIGNFLGLALVFAVCFLEKKGFYSLSLTLRPTHIFKGIFSGAVLMLIPIGIVFGVQTLFDGLRFALPNSPDYFSPMSAVMFAASCAVTAFMQELMFRGYIIRKMRPVYPFADANIVQSVLASVLPLMLVIRNILYGYYDSESAVKKYIFIAAALVFSVVLEFMSSVKRGLVTRVNGNIWASFFDNFFFKLFGGILIINANIITTYPTMIKLLAIQLISILIAHIHYKKQYNRNKIKSERIKSEILQKQKAFEQIEEEKAREILEDISDRSVKEIIENYHNKTIANMGNRPMRPDLSDATDDNIVDISEVKSTEK